MDLSQIQARAATLRKTGRTPDATSPLNLSKSTANPPAPKPKPKRKQQSISAEVCIFSEYKTQHSSYQGQTPTVQESSLPQSSMFDPEEAYDDIESVKEQMRSYIEKEVPPPLPPLNLQRSESINRKNFVPNKNIATRKPTPANIHCKEENERLSTQVQTSNIQMLKRSAIDHADLQIKLPQPKTAGNVLTADVTQDSFKQSKPLHLKQFIEKHKNDFPLQMKVFPKSRGEVCPMMQGDIYNVHFIKSAKVAQIETSKSVQYIVPLNSAIQFGVIYNPVQRIQDAIQGYLFNTVGDIISTPTLPPFVCAQKSFDSSSVDGSIQAGDVLAVRDIQKQFLRGKSLSCTVIGTTHNKKLLENCEGLFSTAPVDVKVYLPDLINYVTLPRECILYCGDNFSSYIPQGVVTLKSLFTEETLILTKYDSNSSSNQQKLFELSTEANILAEAVWPGDLEMERLKINTLNYCYNFSPADVDSTSLLMLDSYHLQTQIALLAPVRYDAFSLCEIEIITGQNLNIATSTLESTLAMDDHYQYPEQIRSDYMLHKESVAEPSSVYDIPQAALRSEEEYDVPPPRNQHTQQLTTRDESPEQQVLDLLQEMVKAVIQTTGLCKIHKYNN